MTRKNGFWMIIMVCASVLFISSAGYSQKTTNTSVLNRISEQSRQKWDAGRNADYYALLESVAPAQVALNENPDIELMYINERGFPVYYSITNLDAARTLSTDDVWPGGSAGYSLTGSGTDFLGVWDAGGVLLSHQEFDGRVVQMDSPSGTHYHSTHVAGTMVAQGQVASAKGMAYQASLDAYDWDYDESEIATAAAAGLLVSSHSYGYITGWYSSGDWYWYGDPDISEVEDYAFGFYHDITAEWDMIAYNAPYLTICKSAGNDRNDYGPGAGNEHYAWIDGGWQLSTTTRDPDGGSDGYDCIPWRGNAKNILTVGAIYDIPGGYTQPSDVSMSSFSGWGPTDDGRIKPDIVANGISLYSTDDDNDSDYRSLSGTSMSTPNTSGSVGLLVQHYQNTHSSATPRASTIKAVIIHTADEAGTNDGPDYEYGWGLMNTTNAADVIAEDEVDDYVIMEDVLSNGETETYTYASSGTEPVRVTVVWTDVPGTPVAPSLNPTTPMLVNDLDVRLEWNATTMYYPWILDPSNPDNAATTGDNVLDNIEQIHLESPSAGAYTVQVSHKGTLAADQYYSIVVSGLTAPLAPIDDLVISVESGDAVLNWTSSAPNFNIYGGTDPFGAGTLLDTETTTTWTDVNTSTRPSPYFYYVTAVE